MLTSVVSTVVAAAAGRKIKEVGLRVGARSGVVAEALEASWPIARAETACQEANLVITEVPAAVWCPSCEQEQPIDEFFALTCPVCDTPTADLRHGKEFEIAYVDVDTQD
ncbi:Zn finger protein HypA/HybF (possibly regulating hydrogenase expression) [Corynebacterium epidermidicanis]|uniref:Zn finger protein HypA/HybF (Possibly regulating hydrogenase expression) n=2 Tax=Corynebacterium epidermidicanis TaxID=1050174 RepID=A0A0G3GUF2_9CORY|nr:Zn finger protein HypA/HybF (possibly regulating hydrogenase expression) [Corynebacterium epidermidicanis]